jgi:hypothetical protein
METLFVEKELVFWSAAKEMSDGDQDDRAESRGSQGKKEAIGRSYDAEFGENPAAYDGANQTEDNVADAAEAASAGELSGEPTGDQAEKKPGHEALRPPFNNDDFFLHKRQQCRHTVS